jgi:hypothetical protein
MSSAAVGAAPELRDALKDAMERSGALRKLQAAARAEAYRALGSGEVRRRCCGGRGAAQLSTHGRTRCALTVLRQPCRPALKEPPRP